MQTRKHFNLFHVRLMGFGILWEVVSVVLIINRKEKNIHLAGWEHACLFLPQTRTVQTLRRVRLPVDYVEEEQAQK